MKMRSNMDFRVAFTRISGNEKTGFIPVTTTEESTCPDNCSLKNNGCYAKFGRVSMHWRKISAGERGGSWDALCAEVEKLPRKQLWRHNVAGDLPGLNNLIDTNRLAQLVEANRGKRGFTFTHKPVGLKGLELFNARAIRAANKNGFTINLSADSLAQADELVALDIAPVAVVLPLYASERVSKTPAGNTVVVCPATRFKTKVTCETCQLCAVVSRKCIVGFPAHGVRKKHVSQLVQLRKKAAQRAA
jgi:hypothetical protein